MSADDRQAMGRTRRWLATAALLLTLPLARSGKAETLEGVFARGNEAFFDGDYGSAIEAYRGLVEAGIDDPDVHYNAGTAYARNGQLGQAILAFERAARLAPGDASVEQALSQAREAIGRRMAAEQGEATVRTRPPLQAALVRGVSEGTLVGALWVFNGLFFGLLITRLFVRPASHQDKQQDTRRLALGMGAAVAGLATALAAGALAVKVGVGEPGTPAVVVGRDASLREGPTARAKGRQPAPEGALGWVVQREGDWSLVRLQGGGQGWLQRTEFGTVDPQARP